MVNNKHKVVLSKSKVKSQDTIKGGVELGLLRELGLEEKII